MNHVWTVFCARSIVDRGTNQVTLVDAIEVIGLLVTAEEEAKVKEGLTRKEDLAFPMETILVSLWTRSQLEVPEKGIYRTTLFAPDGSPCPPVVQKEHTVDLTAHPRLRTSLKLSGLPLRGPGLHSFQLEQNMGADQWETVARVPFVITYDRVGTEGVPAEPPKKERRDKKK